MTQLATLEEALATKSAELLESREALAAKTAEAAEAEASHKAEVAAGVLQAVSAAESEAALVWMVLSMTTKYCTVSKP